MGKIKEWAATNLGPTDHNKQDEQPLTLISQLALQMTTVPTLDDWTYDDFSDETKVDTTNTTTPYAGVGDSNDGAWFCTLYDQFDDSSVDTTTKWTNTNTTSGSATASTTEGAQYLTLSAYGTNSGDVGTATLTSQSTSLDMKGQDGEFQSFVHYYTAETDSSGGSAASYARCQFMVGSTVVYTIAQTQGGGATVTGYADVRMVFDDSASTVDVYKNGTKVVSAFDISGETNYTVGVRAYITSATASDNLYATLKVYTCGYVQNGDTNSPDFVSSTVTASETAETVHALVEMDTSTAPTIAATGDGTNYTTVNHKKLDTLANTGTSIKLKISEQVPSITSTTANIRRLDKYALHYG